MIMTTLTQWYPWREMNRAQEELSRFFDDRFVLLAGEPSGWTPAADIYEDEDGLTVKLELAGVEPKDVDIRFENGVLTIKGERKLERGEKKERYHLAELSHGAFVRSFSLPPTLDADKIEAQSKSGVLVVHLPKKAEAKPKSIQVKVN
jgi:HSP20 family protein